MLFRFWLVLVNAVLSLVGYQTPVNQFKSLSVSCVKVGATVYLEVDAEIPDSALFLNQLKVVEGDLTIQLTFRKRFVVPRKSIFVDKIVVSTSAVTSVQTTPSLNVAWHKIRISLGQLSGHSYALNVVEHGSDHTIGQCSL